MAVSSGLRNTLSEAASWLASAAILVAGVVYYDELRSGLGALIGIEEIAGAAQPQPVPRPQGAGNDIERRLRDAEARASDAEARARQAEARAREQQDSVARAHQRQAEARRSRPIFNNTVELKMGRNGHFFAKAELNGRDVDVLVDTGASMVALTYEDAERAGIRVTSNDFTGRSNTANGIARFAPVTIDQISIGNLTVRNVQGSVAEPGRLHVTLLGMSFIGRLKRAEMKDGVLLLED
jgi:aspartyl protease family protein